MGRWQPGARERLEQAALDLFLEQGFTETTVPQITARAGLTTRTFFRHFADKREVLFAGDESVPEQVARLMADAPPALGPMELIAGGLAPAAAEIIEGRSLDYVRRRRAAIDAEPALQERELRKFSQMAEAMERGFRDRGADDLTARLAAEIAVTAFRVAVTRWLDQHGDPDLPTTVNQTLAAMTHLLGTQAGQPLAPERQGAFDAGNGPRGGQGDLGPSREADRRGEGADVLGDRGDPGDRLHGQGEADREPHQEYDDGHRADEAAGAGESPVEPRP
jgi:AcrR family transcriptional regulator